MVIMNYEGVKKSNSPAKVLLFFDIRKGIMIYELRIKN